MDPLLYLTGCALTGLLSHPHLAADHPMTGDAAKLGARARELARATMLGLDVTVAPVHIIVDEWMFGEKVPAPGPTQASASAAAKPRR